MRPNKGSIINEPGNSVERATGKWRIKKPVIESGTDTSRCGVCASFCPEGAIFKDEDGKYVWDYMYCKGCGICCNECPTKAVRMVKENE